MSSPFGIRFFTTGYAKTSSEMASVEKQAKGINTGFTQMGRTGAASGPMAARGISILKSGITGTVGVLKGFVSLTVKATVALSAIGGVVAGVGIALATKFAKGLMATREGFYLIETALTGVVKNAGQVQKISDWAMKYAATYPAMYSDVMDAMKGLAMMPSLKPIFTKASVDDMEKIMNIVQSLGALDPQQGVRGALLAMREALSGNWRTLQMRFEIRPEAVAEAAGLSMDELRTDPGKAIEALDAFTRLNVGAETLRKSAQSLGVQWGNLSDKYEMFLNKVGKYGAYRKLVEFLMKMNDIWEKMLQSDAAKKIGQDISRVFEAVIGSVESIMTGMDWEGKGIFGGLIDAGKKAMDKLKGVFLESKDFLAAAMKVVFIYIKTALVFSVKEIFWPVGVEIAKAIGDAFIETIEKHPFKSILGAMILGAATGGIPGAVAIGGGMAVTTLEFGRRRVAKETADGTPPIQKNQVIKKEPVSVPSLVSGESKKPPVTTGQAPEVKKIKVIKEGIAELETELKKPTFWLRFFKGADYSDTAKKKLESLKKELLELNNVGNVQAPRLVAGEVKETVVQPKERSAQKVPFWRQLWKIPEYKGPISATVTSGQDNEEKKIQDIKERLGGLENELQNSSGWLKFWGGADYSGVAKEKLKKIKEELLELKNTEAISAADLVEGETKVGIVATVQVPETNEIEYIKERIIGLESELNNSSGWLNFWKDAGYSDVAWEKLENLKKKIIELKTAEKERSKGGGVTPGRTNDEQKINDIKKAIIGLENEFQNSSGWVKFWKGSENSDIVKNKLESLKKELNNVEAEKGGVVVTGQPNESKAAINKLKAEGSALAKIFNTKLGPTKEIEEPTAVGEQSKKVVEARSSLRLAELTGEKAMIDVLKEQLSYEERLLGYHQKVASWEKDPKKGVREEELKKEIATLKESLSISIGKGVPSKDPGLISMENTLAIKQIEAEKLKKEKKAEVGDVTRYTGAELEEKAAVAMEKKKDIMIKTLGVEEQIAKLKKEGGEDISQLVDLEEKLLDLVKEKAAAEKQYANAKKQQIDIQRRIETEMPAQAAIGMLDTAKSHFQTFMDWIRRKGKQFGGAEIPGMGMTWRGGSKESKGYKTKGIPEFFLKQEEKLREQLSQSKESPVAQKMILEKLYSANVEQFGMAKGTAAKGAQFLEANKFMEQLQKVDTQLQEEQIALAKEQAGNIAKMVIELQTANKWLSGINGKSGQSQTDTPSLSGNRKITGANPLTASFGVM